MKKILPLLILLMLVSALAFGAGLDGKTYSLFLDDTAFCLDFNAGTVVVSRDDLEVSFGYYFDDPLGTIEGIPFYIWDQYIVLVTQSIVGTDVTPSPSPTPTPTPEPNDPIDLSKVTWLHTNVSKWDVTANLKSVKIGSTTIEVNYDKSCEWPGITIDGSVTVNANPWIFVEMDGVWYAATWEWLRVCQTVKNLYAVDGSHIKVPPLADWHPETGQVYYFMVSGLARQSQRNVLERSNLLKVVWP